MPKQAPAVRGSLTRVVVESLCLGKEGVCPRRMSIMGQRRKCADVKSMSAFVKDRWHMTVLGQTIRTGFLSFPGCDNEPRPAARATGPGVGISGGGEIRPELVLMIYYFTLDDDLLILLFHGRLPVFASRATLDRPCDMNA